MSSTVRAPYIELGEGGDYPVEMNYAVRVYDNLGEKIPNVGEYGASLKGGQRTNFIGEVPLLDGRKERVGKAEIIRIISAKPENISEEEIQSCGFANIEDAIEYVAKEHKEEFERDGVMTVFTYRVTERQGK